jgi:hypothetical protein
MICSADPAEVVETFLRELQRGVSNRGGTVKAVVGKAEMHRCSEEED